MVLDQTLSQQLDIYIYIDNEIKVTGEHFVLAQGLQKRKRKRNYVQPTSVEFIEKFQPDKHKSRLLCLIS
jgi:hypothetical protein